MHHTVSDFASSFEFTNDVKNMEVNFWIAFCLLHPCTSQNESCPEQWEKHSQFKACEFIIQILYILYLHKSGVTTLDMAWQQSWCDMSKVRPDLPE